MIKLEYFSQIYAEYHSLDKSRRALLIADCPQSLSVAITDMDKGVYKLEMIDWRDIQIFEMKVLARQPDKNLFRQAWNIRTQYERMVGPEEFKLYQDSKPLTDDDPEGLRIDLGFLVSTFHWTFSMALLREALRKRVSNMISLWTFAVVAVFLFPLAYFQWSTTQLVAPGLARIHLKAAPKGVTPPIPADKAVFHLSKNHPQVEAAIAGGEFTCETLSFYPFVAGVELQPDGPKLELDLASVEGDGPDPWKKQ